MRLFEYLKTMARSCKNAIFLCHIYENGNRGVFEWDHLKAEIIRNTHSIEKGLSLENPREGFGMQKIKELMAQIDKAVSQENMSEVVQMAIDALWAYLDWHACRGIDSKDIQSLRNWILDKPVRSEEEQLGGIQKIKRDKAKEIELKDNLIQLIKNRHSVRQFTGKEVSSESLFDAINIAKYCPSACNRQAYHVYIVHKSRFNDFSGWVEGIGGFADQADKFLVVTGNISAYRRYEEYQHIVSATIFASYLTLSLSACGIGSCYVQRPVIPNNKWNQIRKRFGIKDNEQIVCMIAIGDVDDAYTAPISHRLSTESLVTEIK